MIALSFYIGCFRLSSGKESNSKWCRALFRGSGAERKRQLRYGCRSFAQEGQLAHNNNSLDPMCGLCKVQDATSILRHEEANQYIDSGQCGEYLFSS